MPVTSNNSANSAKKPHSNTQRSTQQKQHAAHQKPQAITSSQIYAPAQTFGWVIFAGIALALVGTSALLAFLHNLRPRQKQPFPVRPSFSLPAPSLAPRPQTDATGSYRLAASLLTPTEAAFYRELRAAVGPLAAIQCKVRLADILLTPERDLRAFRRVSQKHLDFLLCETASLRPLLAVELDDRSHDRADRQARDHFVDSAYAQAGLPVLHVKTAPHYSPAELLALVQPHLLSPCALHPADPSTPCPVGI